MSPGIATALCVCFILALFRSVRDPSAGVSSALWIPVVWLSLGSSRSVMQWIGGVQSGELVEQYVEGSPVDALIFAGILASGLVVLVGRRQLVGSFLRANWPLIFFFVYCGLSALWSDYPSVAFKRWVKAVGDFVMVLIVVTDPEPTGAVKRLLTRPAFVLVPLSLLLIRYYPHLGMAFSPWSGERMNTGVATQKNGLGYICLLFGLGSFWFLFEALRDRERVRSVAPLIAHSAVLAITFWLFLLAGSATAFSCFLIGACMLVATSLQMVRQSPAVLHLLVGTLLFTVLYGLILNPGGMLTQTAGRDPTLTGRTTMWNLLYEMSVDPWLGVGYETFWLGPRLQEIWETQQHVHQAHNGYLEVYLNLGWIGVGLLGVVMAWGYRNANRSLGLYPEVGKLRLAFFVVAAVYNLTEHAFRELHPVWIIFLLAVIAMPKDSSREAESSSVMLHSEVTQGSRLSANFNFSTRRNR